jgi:C-terminal processing protease CtpA/Prc
LNEENVLVINGVGTSPSWMPVLEDLEIDPITITTTESGFGPSDHTSFYLKDIPVLHFFTGQHSEYHKPTDDSELINYEGIDLVSQYIYQLVTALDGEEKLTFTKTKDQSQGSRASSFKVTLGVVPDYTYGKKGMRIDGVSEGKPAQKAGLQQGDVILKIGDKEIEDIYAYMEALGSFEPEQSTTIVIQRGEEQLTLPLTF